MIEPNCLDIKHMKEEASWHKRIEERAVAWTDKLIPLDYKNKEHLYAAAKLHKELLNESPVPQLGYEFMVKFYYSKLVKLGLIKCDLYKHEGGYVGFLAYTKYPFTFMEKGKRRYFIYLSLLLIKNLFLNPGRIRAIFRAVRWGEKRLHLKDDGQTGEMLSFGVLEPYCKLKDEATGLRVSNLLFEHVAAYFKREGFKRVQGEVRKDNYPTLFFWRSYGASIKDYTWGKEGNYLVTLEL